MKEDEYVYFAKAAGTVACAICFLIAIVMFFDLIM